MSRKRLANLFVAIVRLESSTCLMEETANHHAFTACQELMALQLELPFVISLNNHLLSYKITLAKIYLVNLQVNHLSLQRLFHLCC